MDYNQQEDKNMATSSEKIKILISNDNVLNIYQFGSRVYGSHNPNSDWDYIVVSKLYFDPEDINIHVFTEAQYQLALNRCDIQALECQYCDDEFKLKETIKFKFKVVKSELRRSISTIVSNSWVKGKKKLIVTGDYDQHLALKSIFHSVRILDFGIQIATDDRIVNFCSMNYFYADLRKLAETYQRDELWNKIDEKYRGFYNTQSSVFKSLCPKDLTETNNKNLLVSILTKHKLENNEELINDILSLLEK